MEAEAFSMICDLQNASQVENSALWRARGRLALSQECIMDFPGPSRFPDFSLLGASCFVSVLLFLVN